MGLVLEHFHRVRSAGGRLPAGRARSGDGSSGLLGPWSSGPRQIMTRLPGGRGRPYAVEHLPVCVRLTLGMTTSELTATVPDIPGGPYDLEFFFDPGCPFAWQTSVWVRRVMELKGVTVGWRFISLRFINEDKDLSDGMVRAQERGLRFHRICAAARESLGNDAVADLYRAFGERFWYDVPEGDVGARMSAAAAATEPDVIVRALGLPEELLAAADDTSWDVIDPGRERRSLPPDRPRRGHAHHHLRRGGQLALRSGHQLGARRRDLGGPVRRRPGARRPADVLGAEAQRPGASSTCRSSAPRS